ncbi:MAG: hypothetical protein ABWY62_05125, partial [Acidimicrobiia bacterium]
MTGSPPDPPEGSPEEALEVPGAEAGQAAEEAAGTTDADVPAVDEATEAASATEDAPGEEAVAAEAGPGEEAAAVEAAPGEEAAAAEKDAP